MPKCTPFSQGFIVLLYPFWAWKSLFNIVWPSKQQCYRLFSQRSAHLRKKLRRLAAKAAREALAVTGDLLKPYGSVDGNLSCAVAPVPGITIIQSCQRHWRALRRLKIRVTERHVNKRLKCVKHKSCTSVCAHGSRPRFTLLWLLGHVC